MEQSRKKNLMYARWFLIRLSMVLYDIVVVNASYYAALLIRFRVADEISRWGVGYFPAFRAFAPFYTVCCLVIFYFFRLYDSKWKYAGLNDLNRIAVASIVTCVIQVAGTMLFVMRMPITYYFIGAVIQFVLIVGSRFSYRFLAAEGTRVRKQISKTTINVMVVGIGETSRTVVKHLEQNADNAAKPVCLVDFRGDEFGGMLEGIPVVNGLDKIAAAIEKYGVESVILADMMMPDHIRQQIHQICQEIGVAVQEFSSYFQDFHGTISLKNLLAYSKGPVELVLDHNRQIFADGEQAFSSLTGKYVVNSICAQDSRLVIELQKDILVPNNENDEWVRSYKEETGEDVSFF